jgi:F-type H+-transporting ATPase subunit a
MPEHTSFFSYLIHLFPALGENMKNLGSTWYLKAPLSEHNLEPLVASLFVVLLILGLAFAVKGKLAKPEDAVIPDENLTLRTFFELVIGMFYGMMKDIMGPKRAKQFFPVIGTAALFILFSNYLGMVPGILPPTSSLRITVGCSIVVFLAFNYYGIKENGIGYFKHLCGPWMGPLGLPINILIFAVEVVSLFVRPVTLAMRLFLNLAVDHLLLTIFSGLVALFVPIPIMILGVLVCIVQVVVFCLLSSIYIGLATEHEDHGESHGHGAKAHGDHAHA